MNQEILKLIEKIGEENVKNLLQKRVDEIERKLKKVIVTIGKAYDIDYRFKCWSKTIESVDLEKKDGYAFVGKFINMRVDELAVGIRIMTYIRSGSRKHQKVDVYIDEVIDDFKKWNLKELAHFDIREADSDVWALLIRNKVYNVINIHQ
jgi:hypothetical protein